MKYRTAISIIVASMLAFTSMSSFAAPRERGGPSVDRTHQVDRDRTHDRDRMADRDRMHDRARTGVPEQDRDRDRIHDPASIRDQDIYGHEFMSPAECDQYRQSLRDSNTPALRSELQIRHEQKMQERALQTGRDLVPPGQGPIYGGRLMSVQERNEYREQLRLHDSEQESEQFRAQHRDRINQRAAALGLEVEEAE